MVDFGYLYRGLCGLSRAHRANSMAGHLGAAVVAGYFYGEDNGNLEPEIGTAIDGYLDRVVAGEEGLWFDSAKTGITVSEMFRDVDTQATEPGDRALTEGIAKALSGNIGAFRESGHNVIFAAIALRAFDDHPMYATPSLVGGIRRLIESFGESGGGRGYYGAERGWVEAEEVALDDSVPEYSSLEGMAAVVVDELLRSAQERRQSFGGPWHVINHAAALVELAVQGHRDLARQGFAAHRKHVQLWKTLPNLKDELGDRTKVTLQPTDAAFWTTKTPNGQEGVPNPPDQDALRLWTVDECRG